MTFYTVRKDGIALHVKVQPGAGVNRIVGVRGGELLIKVKGAPERGKANKDLVNLLARALGLPKARLELAAGAASRHKRILLPAEALEVVRRMADG